MRLLAYRIYITRKEEKEASMIIDSAVASMQISPRLFLQKYILLFRKLKHGLSLKRHIIKKYHLN